MYVYLLINILSFLLPFAFSFHPQILFYKKWPGLLAGIITMMMLFVPWDILFTDIGIWGFNPRYISGFTLLNLPIEEWLFFFCIPYSSIFIYHILSIHAPKIFLSRSGTQGLTISLAIVLGSMALINMDKLYTLSAFTLTAVILILVLLTSPKILQTFYPSYLIILVPFFIVNGILTGSFIENEVVWYNDGHNLGIRLFTIPIEDTMYALSMLLMSIVVMETINRKLENRHTKNKNISYSRLQADITR